MQLTTILLASIATLAAAQTTTAPAGTAPSCPAQVTLDACIGTIQAQINACGLTDYSCLCNQYQNLLTCYANCPQDPGVATVQQQREQNCIAASVYGTTTTLGTASATSLATLTTSDASSTEVTTGFASETSSGAAASSTGESSGNGASGLEIARGLVAFAAAGFAFL